MLEVEVRNVSGRPAAIGRAGAHTLVVESTTEARGDRLGFNGGELLLLAIAGCVSNDLFREAAAAGITLRGVRVRASADFAGDPAICGPVAYEVELDADGEPDRLRELVALVDRIAEIPNSVRHGAEVRLKATHLPPR